jgi:multidrug efflux pump subunit AcrB
MGLLGFFTEQKIFVNMIAVLVTGAGIFMFATSPKESLPEIKFGVVQITALYAGANPAEVESLVTDPIEDAVKDIPGIKEMSSLSGEGISVIVIELFENIKDTSEVVDDIKSAIDKILADLPEEAEDPEVFEISSEEFPVIQLAVYGDVAYGELRNEAVEIEDKLLGIKGVSSVNKLGFLDRAIWIDADSGSLESYSVTLVEVINSLRNRNISVPAGYDYFVGREISIRVLAKLEDKEDVGDVIVRSNYSGNKVRVKTVAAVREGYKDEEYLARVNGSQAIIFTVLKRQGEDSISIAREVKELAAGHSHGKISVTVSGDNSVFIKDRLGLIYSNGLLGAFLVMLVLFIFLRPSIAVMTAVGLPVAFGASLLMIKVLGIGYNMLSLFGYVIVLGMLVDDAVIVAENIYRHIEMGKSRLRAAVDGASEMLMPVIAAFSTTIAAFLPLMFIGGIFGEFLSPIPSVIIIALTASLIECFFILPSHLAHFGKAVSDTVLTRFRKKTFDSLREIYGRMLLWIINRRAFFIAGVVVMLVLATFLAGRRGFRFFESQVDEVSVNLRTPVKNSLEDTEKTVSELEGALSEISKNDLTDIFSFIGYNQVSEAEPRIVGSNLGIIKLYFKIKTERETKDPEQLLRKVRAIVSGNVNVEEFTVAGVTRGPPPGKDIDLSFAGSTHERLRTVAEEAASEIRGIEGVDEISPDIKDCKVEARLIIDEKQATRMDVLPSQVALTLRSAVTGIEVNSIRRSGENIALLVRLDKKDRKKLENILDLRVLTVKGYRVKLKDLVNVEMGCTYTVLKHRNAKKTVSVIGSIDKSKTNITEVNSEISKILKRYREKYPGVDSEIGGEFRETSDNFINLGRLYLAALFIIFTILATTFNSLSMPFIIMMAIPFGFTGVMLTLFIHGMPISFPAFMGFVALSGVVVNDSLIIIDFVNKKLKEGNDIVTSVIEAAKLRLRPIMITTITTAIGILPIGYAVFGSQDPLLRPLALVFAWGILFASIVTLSVLPTLVVALDGLKKKLNKLFGRRRNDRSGRDMQ